MKRARCTIKKLLANQAREQQYKDKKIIMGPKCLKVGIEYSLYKYIKIIKVFAKCEMFLISTSPLVL